MIGERTIEQAKLTLPECSCVVYWLAGLYLVLFGELACWVFRNWS